MFVVTEADAAAIRAVYEQRGKFAAAIELRRRFLSISDNAQARECPRDHRRLEAAAAAVGGSAQTARERGGWEFIKDSMVTDGETAQVPESETGGYLGHSCFGRRRQQRSSHEMYAPPH
jgi:hypothetical protein